MYGSDHSHSDYAHYGHDHSGYATSSHNHNHYEVYGAADEHHAHGDYAYAGHDHDQAHDHDGEYAPATLTEDVSAAVAQLAKYWAHVNAWTGRTIELERALALPIGLGKLADTNEAVSGLRGQVAALEDLCGKLVTMIGGLLGRVHDLEQTLNLPPNPAYTVPGTGPEPGLKTAMDEALRRDVMAHWKDPEPGPEPGRGGVGEWRQTPPAGVGEWPSETAPAE